MPRSSFCSERQTSSSLMRRFIAPRPLDDDDFDFFFPEPPAGAGPPGLELESGRFWIRHDILGEQVGRARAATDKNVGEKVG